jgi:hypothetical protein
MRDSLHYRKPKLPLFFKIWFGFIAALVLTVFGVVGFMFYTAATLAGDPEAIGSYIGKIQSGYERAIGE